LKGKGRIVSGKFPKLLTFLLPAGNLLFRLLKGKNKMSDPGNYLFLIFS